MEGRAPSAEAVILRRMSEERALPRGRLAVLASGAGSTFVHLVRAGQAGAFPGAVSLLITTRPDAPVAERARDLRVEHLLLDAKSLGSETCDANMCAVLTERSIDLIVLAGYLRKIGPRTLHTFAGRIINTHPAPLPEFGGQGMHGDHVHQAVLAAGVSHSAATVHLVDENYDTGPVLAVQPVPIRPTDTVETLRDRVQQAEREQLTQTIVTLLTREELPRN
jgi:phosphoribosylglycinamide formyltransferase-1